MKTDIIMTKLKVLLVDDDLTFKMYVEEILQQKTDSDVYFFEIDPVGNMEECMLSLEKHSYDIVLLDLNLPDSKGSSTFTKIVSSYPNQTIIILSEVVNVHIAIESIDKGVQDFIVKSDVTRPLLVRSINYAIERRKILLSMEDIIRERTNNLKTAASFALELNRFHYSVMQSCEDSMEDQLYNIMETFGKILKSEFIFLYSMDINEVINYILINKWVINDDVKNNTKNLSLLSSGNIDEDYCYVWHRSVSNRVSKWSQIKNLSNDEKDVFFSSFKPEYTLVTIPLYGSNKNPWGFLLILSDRPKWSNLEIDIIKGLGSLISWVKYIIEKNNSLSLMADDFDELLDSIKIRSEKLKSKSAGGTD